ncbi:MAG TPA: tetraacyldisaccharide 4'-kinase, partial [Planctomycetota bacterium]|nr:tetraacyldisaccharide 4'-kinase [Planctomycetota bacterium]
RAPDTLRGRHVYLFCGIASPAGFRQTVEQLHAHVEGLMAFGDHHDFTPGDLARVRSEARDHLILCTEKDAAKIARIPGSGDVECLVIDLQLEGGLPPILGIDAPWTPPAAEIDEHAAHAQPSHAAVAGHAGGGHDAHGHDHGAHASHGHDHGTHASHGHGSAPH